MQARRTAVYNAGQQGVEMIRTWADGKLNEHRGFWMKLWQSFVDWGHQAKAQLLAWEASRNKALTYDMANDMSFLGRWHLPPLTSSIRNSWTP